jgi:hypothetical protein|tara:strand:- start:186 stop:611 length:426 start_codon:yes stop_codon:yes gene_type:complete
VVVAKAVVQTAITAAAVTTTTAATTTAAATTNRPKEVGSKDPVEEEVDNKIRVGLVFKATMVEVEEEEEEEGTITVVGAVEEGTTVVVATVVAGVEVVVAGATRTTVVFTGALEEMNAANKVCSATCKTQASILTSTTTFP